MSRANKIFLFSIVFIPLTVLIAIELAFRLSPPFNDFVFHNSTPRKSDHFRLAYRLNKAKSDTSRPKVGILGTSVAREGIDERLLQKQFPQVSFYNFGSTLKLPRTEVDLLPQYLEGKFDIFIYPISAVDIFKFSLASGLNMYPSWDLIRSAFLDREWEEVLDRQASVVWAALSIPSRAALYRDVLFSAVGSWSAKTLGIPAVSDFNYFWQQQEVEDEEIFRKKLQYAEKRGKFFDRKILRVDDNLREMAATFRQAGVRFIIYDMPETCAKLRARMPGRARRAGDNFSRLLAKIPQDFANTEYIHAPDFACSDYSDTFHLNEAGRIKSFAHLTEILQSRVHAGTTEFQIEDLQGQSPTATRDFDIRGKRAEEKRYVIGEGEVTVRKVSDVTAEAFGKSLALREFELSRPFREERSPYPGAVTAAQKCPESFRAKISKGEKQGGQFWRAEIPASARRTQVCADNEFVTKLVEQIVFCPRSKTLYTISGHTSRTRGNPDWSTWLKNFSCGN